MIRHINGKPKSLYPERGRVGYAENRREIVRAVVYQGVCPGTNAPTFLEINRDGKNTLRISDDGLYLEYETPICEMRFKIEVVHIDFLRTYFKRPRRRAHGQ